MSKVVYLLGAGASYGKRLDPNKLTMDDVSLIEEGLPIVSEINEEIEYVIGWLNNNIDLGSEDYTFKGNKCDAYKLKVELINGLEWMLEESSKHATIDTFAKKLYLKNDINNYGKLKFLLSTFFLIEQYLHPYDKRYDTFLASILDSDLAFPKEIFVMTWNYDMQLDIVYRDYKERGLPMCIPSETSNVTKDARVFKINGSANYYPANQLDSPICLNNDESFVLKKILKQLSTTTQRGYYSDGTTYLLFAWEKNKFDEMSKMLYDNISNAEVLVIIGYTFPYFNREIDREIFANMPNLKTIYIQDPNAISVKESLYSVMNIKRSDFLKKEIILLESTEYFFLPPEL